MPKPVEKDKSDLSDKSSPDSFKKFAYHISPSVLKIPSKGVLEVTLRPSKPLGGRVQFVLISLTSGYCVIDNYSREFGAATQLFGFFERDEILKFGIRLRNESEVGHPPSLEFLFICHACVTSEEAAWKMVRAKYGLGMIDEFPDWILEPGNAVRFFDLCDKNSEEVRAIEKTRQKKKEAAEKKKKEAAKRIDKNYKDPWEISIENGEVYCGDDMEELARIRRRDNLKATEGLDWRKENRGLTVIKIGEFNTERSNKSVKSGKLNCSNTSGDIQKSAGSQKSSTKSHGASQSGANSKSQITQGEEQVTGNHKQSQKKPKGKKRNPCCSIL